MKKLQCIFLLSFLVSFFFSSCNKHLIVEELIKAEKLMTNNPDSALVLLESIASPEKMRKFDIISLNELPAGNYRIEISHQYGYVNCEFNLNN